jgi:DNA-directed RNA polymerase beta' subunit
MIDGSIFLLYKMVEIAISTQTMKSNNLISSAEIASVQYYVNGDADVVKKFPRKTNRTALFTGDVPVNGGPCSLSLGTIDYQFMCHTCQNGKKFCPGHNGYIKLKFPIF